MVFGLLSFLFILFEVVEPRSIVLDDIQLSGDSPKLHQASEPEGSCSIYENPGLGGMDASATVKPGYNDTVGTENYILRG
jgi:hypothetical protein